MLTILLLLIQSSYSQIVISPIGGGGVIMSPFSFSSKSKCIEVSSGYSIFLIDKTKGNFNDACLEVAPQHKEVKLTVYPNPVRRTTLLKVSGLNTGSYSVQVIAADGKIHLQKTQVLQTTLESGLQLDLSSLAAATYFIAVLAQDGFRSVTKVIKLAP